MQVLPIYFELLGGIAYMLIVLIHIRLGPSDFKTLLLNQHPDALIPSGMVSSGA